MKTEQGNPMAAKVLLFCCRHRIPAFGKIVRMLLHCDIYCDPRDRLILMPHPYGIIIHSLARIGNDVTIPWRAFASLKLSFNPRRMPGPYERLNRLIRPS